MTAPVSLKVAALSIDCADSSGTGRAVAAIRSGLWPLVSA